MKIVSVVSVVVSLNLLNLFPNDLNPSIVSCLIFVSDLSLGRIGAVELYVHYCFVEQLLFFLCEFLGQQLADGSEMKSLAQRRKSKMQHAVVVERQLRYLVDAEPLSLCSIVATLYFFFFLVVVGFVVVVVAVVSVAAGSVVVSVGCVVTPASALDTA